MIVWISETGKYLRPAKSVRLFQVDQGLLTGQEPARRLIMTRQMIEAPSKMRIVLATKYHRAVMPCTMSISMKVRSGAKLPTASFSLTPVSVNANTLCRSKT